MHDTITPFLIQNLDVRGRMAVMDTSIAAIIARHAYPKVVSRMLAELILLGTTLAHAFKFDGVFTLQIQGDKDAPLSFMVVDIVCGDASLSPDASYVRACASMRDGAKEKLDALENARVFDVFGQGNIAFSLDLTQNTDTDEQRYQGIVELSGATIHECLQHYFRQSEQLETVFFVALDDAYKGRCIMLQTMPFDGEKNPAAHDKWITSMTLLRTLSKNELMEHTDYTILTRLFKSEGVEIYDAKNVMFKCRCSREKLEPFIDELSLEERNDIAKDGVIRVSCDFCNAKYEFSANP